ncbi:MAG: hypothetical protein ABSF62_02450 [Bryobacteraceae bacterium]
MSDTVIVALISAGGSVAVAITALILNVRLFGSLDRRMERLEEDNKEFFKWFGRLESDIGRIKDHIGLKP